ncbi:MAG: hypothetical protein CMM01_16005 [Rhodopirellula sp.]|nr:hypothetical protein [Rhodopirellula sp.]
MTSEPDSEWFLKNTEGTLGPLSESDMRKHVERSTDDALLIRQGSSDWRSVDVIRRKICQLQKNGIFIRYKKVAEGPFTLTRAHDVLKCMPPGGIDVRTGAAGKWVPADKWLSKIDKLLAIESKDMDSLSVAVQHVLGRQGFVAPAQLSGELDLADADKEIVAATTETETPIETPRWLSPEPIIEAEPVYEAQPIIESEATRASRSQPSDHQHLQTEPVIEVVKVMHTAAIADRDQRKPRAQTVPPALPAAGGKPHGGNRRGVKNEPCNEESPGTLPAEATSRIRPRNNTSRTNRTRTSQEKLVIAGLSAAIIIVLSIAGWKWLAETGTTVAERQTVSELQTTVDLPIAGSIKHSGSGNDSLGAGARPDPSPSEPRKSVAGADSKDTGSSAEKPEIGDQASSGTQRQRDFESQKSLPQNGNQAALPAATAQPDRSKIAPLVLSTGTLFHPRFGTSEGEVSGGTAFAAKLTGKSQILLLSALNLFGPAGGLKKNIESDKLTTIWKKVVAEDCKTQNYFGEIQMQPIPLSGARPHPHKSDLGDIAACKVNDATAIEALPLSQRIPSNGERVWLLSRLPGLRELLHPATVERLDNGWLRYSFANRNINLKSTGGAPIIDHRGKVVAVNANIIKKSGKTIGYGTPVVNFYPTLATLVQ